MRTRSEKAADNETNKEPDPEPPRDHQKAKGKDVTEHPREAETVNETSGPLARAPA